MVSIGDKFRFPVRWPEMNDLQQEITRGILEERDIALEDYLDALAGGGGSGGSMYITVASSDAPTDVQDRADYVCDGVDDDVQIQAAIDEIAAAGGGTVHLSGGRFFLAAKVIIRNSTATSTLDSNITLLGSGSQSTGGIADEGTVLMNKDAILLNPAIEIYVSGAVRNLSLFRNTTGGGGMAKGIQNTASGSAGTATVRYDNLTFGNLTNSAIQVGAGNGASAYVTNCTFNGSAVGVDAGGAFSTGDESTIIVGCTFDSCTNQGVFIGRLNNAVIVSSNLFTGTTGSGILIDPVGGAGNNSCLIVGNNFTKLSPSLSAIRLNNNADNHAIIGNTGGTVVIASANCDNNFVVANKMGLTDSGTGTVAGLNNTSAVTDHGALTGLSDDDHTQYLLRSILTTRGDLYRRGASAIERVALGATNEVLTSDGTDAVWDAHSYEGYTTLTDDTASATGAWEAWGTESVTIADPGRAVKIVARLHGEAEFTGVGTDSQVRCRLRISTDGGGSFTNQRDTGSAVGTATASDLTTLASGGRVSATPTGSIIVDAQLQQVSGTAGDVSFQQGSIEVIVLPA